MPRGASLAMVQRAATDLGFASRALRIELQQLRSFTQPLILHWRFNHYVVLVACSRFGLIIHDPAAGRVRVSWTEADAAFTGVVLELSPHFQLQPATPVPRLRLRDFARNLRGLWGGVGQLLGLSLALQLVLLCAPLYTQLVIDDALPLGETHLLLVLAWGFALLVLLQVALQIVRGWLLVVLGTQLARGVGTALQQRLLSLSLDWFERRSTGDVLSRFRSARPVTDLLLQGGALAFVDGLMALLALLLMVVYSPLLGALVLVSTLLYTALRLLLYPRFKAAALAQVSAAAQQESLFLESLRGISTIKAFAMEGQRAERWQRCYVDELNQGVRLARLQLGFANLDTLLFGLELVLVIYLGASMVLAGTLTVGMLVALLAYRGQFVTRTVALVQGLLSIRALEVHLERLADIVLAESSTQPAVLASADAAKHPRPLVLHSVAYRRGRYQPDILRDLSFSVPAGRLLAINGPSGSGKSTLLKILMGLLTPTSGHLELGSAGLRARSAAVLQEDRLFAGSVLQNVSQFAEQPDLQWAGEVLDQVGFGGSSAALPMGLETPIFELGGGLSGGQVQRLLLARALYARPDYLFLDECTAHLDPQGAQRVQELIAGLSMTRVVVSHDPAFVARADQIVTLAWNGA